VTEILDSGRRRQFGSGAVRDRSGKKSRPDLISPFAEERLGDWLRLGAEKYTTRNWEKGMPASECLASLCRHLLKVKQGVTDGEDHLAAIVFNAMAIMHYEAMVERGVLPAELLDLQTYGSVCPLKTISGNRPKTRFWRLWTWLRNLRL